MRDLNLDHKVCEYCNDIFKPSRSFQKFCRSICRSRAERGNVVRSRTCSYCEKEFTTANKCQRFCTPCIKSTPEHIRRRSTLDGRLTGLLRMAQNRARKKGLPEDLDINYLMGLWRDQDGVCALSGRKFELGSAKKKRQVHPDAPSLDRIIPEKGYTKGNIRFLTYHCNVCVNEYGDETLIELMKDVFNRRSGRR